jgi:hypothetical protein
MRAGRRPLRVIMAALLSTIAPIQAGVAQAQTMAPETEREFAAMLRAG